MNLFGKTKKLVTRGTVFLKKLHKPTNNNSPKMVSGPVLSRFILYPLIIFLTCLFDVWFDQLKVQDDSLSETDSVQNANSFIANAFISASDNHQAWLNMLFILAFFLFFLAITNRFWLTFLLNNILFIGFGLADAEKISLRNEPILPSDLSLLNNPRELATFVNIGSLQLFILIFLAVLICYLIYLLLNKFDSRVKLTSWVGRIIFLFISVIIFSLAHNLYTPGTRSNNLAKGLNDDPIPWNTVSDSQKNGSVYSFMRFFDNKIMTKPTGYSKAKIRQLNQKYEKMANKINRKRPNYLGKQTVVYVLSEAFSDPSRVPGAHISPDPVPYIRNLKNRTTSGLMLSSGYGGGTANIEYQALTSLSLTNFLPTLTSPYVQLAASAKYLPNVSSSWKIKNAVHPYYPTTYNRSSVYKNMSFQKFYTLFSPKVKYSKKPGSNIYVSDKSAYKDLLWLLKKHHKPQFVQMPTMQNHMPYNNWYKHFPYDFDISSDYYHDDWERNQLNTYTQGANYTDQATHRLIKKLDRIKKPITVVFYGDHLPGIYWKEMEDKKNLLPLHETDYFIYSNKYSRSHGAKLTDKTNYTSPNYFQALADEHMNVKISPFIALLDNLRHNIPASSNALARTNTQMWSTTQAPKNTYLNNQGQRIKKGQLNKKQKQLLSDYKMVSILACLHRL